MGERVGLIGVGLVGTALAENLVARGYDLAGYDIDPARRGKLEELGGTAVGSPAQAAAGRERVVLSLPDSQVVRQVLAGPDGVLSAEPPPRFIIDTTTGDPDAAVELASACAARGSEYLDATVSGSSQQIRRREGVFMIGGSAAAVAACRDVLEALAAKCFHVGPSGSGARAKLAVNLILGLNRLALAEGLVFAERLGLDLEALLPLLKETAAYSRVMDTKGPMMLTGEFAPPQARLAQHLKDVRIILAQADKLGQPLPLTAAHAEVLKAALAAGDGELDNAAVIREVRRRGRRVSP